MTDTRRKFDLDSFAMKLTGGNRMVTFALLLGLGVFMFFWPNTAIKLVVRVAGAPDRRLRLAPLALETVWLEPDPAGPESGAAEVR